jgi:hypothetical protein
MAFRGPKSISQEMVVLIATGAKLLVYIINVSRQTAQNAVSASVMVHYLVYTSRRGLNVTSKESVKELCYVWDSDSGFVLRPYYLDLSQSPNQASLNSPQERLESLLKVLCTT